MSLVNSANNVLKVIDASKSNITVDIYKDMTVFENGLDTNFERTTRTTFNVGTAFDEKLNSMPADDNLTVAANVIYAAEVTLKEIAANDPNRLKVNNIPGDWADPVE